jgi:hypothetical protein
MVHVYHDDLNKIANISQYQQESGGEVRGARAPAAFKI